MQMSGAACLIRQARAEPAMICSKVEVMATIRGRVASTSATKSSTKEPITGASAACAAAAFSARSGSGGSAASISGGQA